MLEECQIFLSLYETNLEVREVKLSEVQACVLHSFDGRDLLAVLEELHVRVAGVEDERATEAGKLSKMVMEISNSLGDLGTLPIQDIPQLPKLAQEVLTATALILENVQEEHAPSAGP
jgi:hypothetical protein